MLQMDGYFAFYMAPASMVLSVVYLLMGYGFVSVIDYLRIRRIPTDTALKKWTCDGVILQKRASARGRMLFF